ncbi:MAG: YebC/PmpR family DNA-binding transcriptional regulator [Candidatus Cloacimonetes bacterium]|jgi:YebC/PmpR family DNA-binding regulatory protein|nr:YebC/PmpR family DNA-binding transcriptional regulator [Candidatus Cloacimonadota bacterium]MBT4576573.1 YebC/PmpR family DNA-binding transcriptional regulator [Candidatus Cloacimonadota bacterium]MBT5421031.1 YebC/PmpR family DNA-binding transcriptional regulator [Candidatus Cloacimonadota bacterium]
MSGHSKWSSIKHKKGAADAKRGKIFTKLVKEIIVAAKEGGGDEEMNPRLRLAVSTAKGANMPNSNIERAIKRGTGELEGVNYEHFTYEGYGHNGVAIIVETLTDNKQRTVADVRHIFSKYGGNLAENGSVSYMFDQKGFIVIPAIELDEDEVMMASLDAGAEDFIVEEDSYLIYTAYADLHSVHKKLEEVGYNIEKAELTRIPQNTINADEVAEKLLKLIDFLEDCDDVQKVYANFEISDEVFERLSEA